MKIIYSQILIFLCFICTNAENVTKKSILSQIVTKYEAIVNDVDFDKSDNMVALREISTNKQLLIIPTTNIMSSEEDYQFKNYFSKNSKEKLIGRLLIEKFVAGDSYFYIFIESLPNIEELTDMYHYSQNHKDELEKRSLVSFTLKDRRIEYDNLVRKIPLNEIPTTLLNWELYNWAHSIIEMYGIHMKKKYYSEVKKLTKFDEPNINDELVLIPGINLFKNGAFKSLVGNAASGTLFAYKEHIYLNSDRYFEENEQIFNEIYFQPNIKLFETSGKFVNGFFHEEMNLKMSTKNWTLKKFNICKDLDCLPKTKAGQFFNLKYEYNHGFFVFCQIDQIAEEDDMVYVYKMIKVGKRINKQNYIKASSRCSNILKEYIIKAKKTSITKDINDLVNQNYYDEKEKTIIQFSLSQKKIIYHHFKLFRNQVIKEFRNEIFVGLKGKYV